MTLDDQPHTRTDRRARTPEKRPAQKRTKEESPEQPPKFQITPDEDNDDDVTMSAMSRKVRSAVLRGVGITEVYSPERVVQACAELGLQRVSSFELTNGWEFSRPAHRKAAWKQIVEEAPYLLIDSPPCTMLSVLQRLDLYARRSDPKWIEDFHHAQRKAIKHTEFCCNLYRYQLRQGRHFLHEHPAGAQPWQLDVVKGTGGRRTHYGRYC